LNRARARWGELVERGIDHMERRDLLPRLGLEPTIGSRVHAALEVAVSEAEDRSPGAVAVLDAGCGRKSRLRPFRSRIDWLVGVDLHEPDPPLPWLDDFVVLDICRPSVDIPAGVFDVALSSFTLEHFADPPAALSNIHRWLRPGGALVVTTVNRLHPFVDGYLRLPETARSRLQPVLKARAADAHPLVGRCNDPATLRRTLEGAGFDQVRIETAPNLARAWGRHRWTFALGLVGDLLTQSMPSRRSTILATARKGPGG